jgi:hypothetical protein
MGAVVIPECAQRGCWWLYHRDPECFYRGYYQHGDNPESVLEVPLLLPSDPEPSSVIRALLSEWVERCHRYEDGEPA